MNELARRPARRNQIKPAPRPHAARSQPQNMRADGIAMMKIVEKPAVQLSRAQLPLNGIYLRHH